jgi:hypothetical protein
MVVVCFAKGKQLPKLMNGSCSSSFMLRVAQQAAVVAIRHHFADLSNWRCRSATRRSHVAVILV